MEVLKFELVTRMLDESFLNSYEIQDYIVAKKFFSKKNEVYLVKATKKDKNKEKYVVKIYSNSLKRMEKEMNMLLELKKMGLAVPKVYYMGRNYFVMEYINGVTLLEEICKQEGYVKEETSSDFFINIKTLEGLLKWLTDFYRFSRQIKNRNIVLGDVNLRNFIVSNKLYGKIYGIDFEDYCEGLPEEDIGKICAFILTYYPAFTKWKQCVVGQIAYIFTEKLKLNFESIKRETIKELMAMEKRRNIVIPIDIINKIENCKL